LWVRPSFDAMSSRRYDVVYGATVSRPGPARAPPPAPLDRLDYHLRFEARSTGGRRARATIHGRGNPGYRSSPNIIAQAALGLARNELPALDGGVLTPASGLGAGFLGRFPAAGPTVSVTAA
jgi:short subunit dehydrogenase-like uncharacterized protein